MQFDPKDVSCRVFGHICPAFVKAQSFSESRETRRWGRYIPHKVMLAVARRDDYRCQLCHEYVKDYDVHFDHRIPYSHGGPTTVSNIRILCGKCICKRSNSLSEIQRD